MTNTLGSPLSPGVREAAAADASASAAAAGVVVELVRDLEGSVRVAAVCDVTWGGEGLLPIDLARALAYPGGTVLLARRRDHGRLTDVGVAVGFLCWGDELHFHSHLVGVTPGQRGAGVGLALKLAQRSSCVSHGVRMMQWTFDPLLAANARLNLSRLGGVATRFLPDCYGQMTDSINNGDRSDRVELSWRLDRPLPSKSSSIALPSVSATVLEIDGDGWPHRTGEPIRPGAGIAIPRDYGEMRRRADPRAPAWRTELGSVLVSVFEAGLVLDGFDDDNYKIGSCPSLGGALEGATEKCHEASGSRLEGQLNPAMTGGLGRMAADTYLSGERSVSGIRIRKARACSVVPA